MWGKSRARVIYILQLYIIYIYIHVCVRVCILYICVCMLRLNGVLIQSGNSNRGSLAPPRRYKSRFLASRVIYGRRGNRTTAAAAACTAVEIFKNNPAQTVFRRTVSPPPQNTSPPVTPLGNMQNGIENSDVILYINVDSYTRVQ